MSHYQQAVDVVVIGGGIAGLFVHHRLHQLGYRSVLLEKSGIGSQQSLLSQGIIHGGMKYALTGTLSNETEAIADMPSRWRELLAGNGVIDLSNARYLSDTQYMWSAGKLASKMTTFLASRLLRGRIRALDRSEYPPIFGDAQFKGQVYELDDIVLDIQSVFNSLLTPVQDRSFLIPENGDIQFTHDSDRIKSVRIVTQDQCIAEFNTQHTVLSAGAGNEGLLNKAGFQLPEMQLRPLNMVLVKHNQALDLYGHCIGTGNKPKMTITTHPRKDGSRVWYLGGEVAENTQRSDQETITSAKKEVKKCLPWVDLKEAEWKTVRIDRAEPKQMKMLKPDTAFVETQQNLTTIWPTKLTLAPDVIDRCEQQLSEWNIKRSTDSDSTFSPPPLEAACVATPFWESF